MAAAILLIVTIAILSIVIIAIILIIIMIIMIIIIAIILIVIVAVLLIVIITAPTNHGNGDQRPISDIVASLHFPTAVNPTCSAINHNSY